MKREIMSVLLGASILVPAAADAQRVRPRGGDRVGDRVEQTHDRVQRPGQPAPIRANGRITRPVRVPAARSYRTPDRIVYSSRGRYHGRARGASFRARYDRVGFAGRHVWARANWGRLWLIPPRRHARLDVLHASALRDILGREAMRMVWDVGRRAGLRGQVLGHWVRDPGVGMVLVVSVGHVDVVEFIDYDRDGLVDDVFVIQDRRWGRAAVRW